MENKTQLTQITIASHNQEDQLQAKKGQEDKELLVTKQVHKLIKLIQQ